MTKVLANLGKLKNGREALVIQNGNTIMGITCRDYDPTAPEGSQWYGGEYTVDAVSFAKLILAEQTGIHPDRVMEIACQAMSYLLDNNMHDDFLEDRDIDLDYDERDFFFPEEEDDDEE